MRIVPSYDYFLPDEQAFIDEEVRKAERETRRRNAKFMRIVKPIFAVECAVVLIEGLYRMGGLFRGYPSFGGEGMLVLALIGAGIYYIRHR